MQRWKNIRQSYTFSTSSSFSSAKFFCFLRPLWGQQEKALVSRTLHCDPTKYDGLKTVLSLTAEHFCLATLHRAYINVFNYSRGFALFRITFVFLIMFGCMMWVPVASEADVKHIYPAKPKTGSTFHRVAVVTQQCTLQMETQLLGNTTDENRRFWDENEDSALTFWCAYHENGNVIVLSIYRTLT